MLYLPLAVLLQVVPVTGPVASPPRQFLRSIPAARSTSLEGLNPALYERAISAWRRANADSGIARGRLAVIDYSLPSTSRRLWVFDVPTGRCLFHELVAHGRGSGDGNATHFSNASGSLATSVGVFVTGDTYQGAHGRSLRLLGLEKGFNDNALARGVVIHAAAYVDAALGARAGRIGRSWGCPALAPQVAGPIIDALAPGAVVFAWGDDAAWQRQSTWLPRELLVTR